MIISKVKTIDIINKNIEKERRGKERQKERERERKRGGTIIKNVFSVVQS
jgi:hypothetical protein